MMKKIWLIILLAAGSFTAHAQELKWINNVEKAVEVSAKTKKPLMLFFTGSDWCFWCHKLENEVFHKPEFSSWVKNKVIPVEVDFPRKTPLPADLQKQNNQLAQFFGIQGYPTVWFVDAVKKDGKITFEKLGSTGYMDGGPGPWIENADEILQNRKSR